MDTNVLLELAGLQTVQKLIADRIAQLQKEAGAGAGTGAPIPAPVVQAAAAAPLTPAPQQPIVKKAPSQAKLEALAKARAALAAKKTALARKGVKRGK